MATKLNTTHGGASPAATRRGLFAAASVLPLAGAAAASQPAPDAALIAACERHIKARAEYNANTDEATEPAQWEAYSSAEDEVLATPATTMQGLLAKAKAADNCGFEELAWSVVEDLLRLRT